MVVKIISRIVLSVLDFIDGFWSGVFAFIEALILDESGQLTSFGELIFEKE